MTTATDQILSFVLVLMIPVAAAIALTLAVVALRSARAKRDVQLSEPDEQPLDDDDEAPAPVPDLPYARRRYLLTQAERDFFAVLRTATPEGWHVFPQVRLANLVMLKRGTRNWKPHYSRVAQKCVDFVLCDADDIGPRLVVELDDSSHDRLDRQARDRFVDAALDAAGLPILHVRWRRRYDVATLAAQIRDAAGLPSLGPSAGASQAGAAATPPLPAPAHAAVSAPARWACRSCGAAVGATAKHCTRCGAHLGEPNEL